MCGRGALKLWPHHEIKAEGKKVSLNPDQLTALEEFGMVEGATLSDRYL